MTVPAPQAVLLTGASGFVGRHVLPELLRRGYAVRALVRRAGSLAAHPSLTECVGDILEPASLPPALLGCTGVIHLVGIIAEKRPRITFERVHFEGSRNLIQAAAAAGVTRFVHMSALGARPEAVARYHQTKWQAEECLRQHAPPLTYTIFRPSLIHGPDGEFTRMLRGWATGRAPPFLYMPYFGRGFWGQSNPCPLTPVFVEDVATLFVMALTSLAAVDQAYEVGGPDRYTWPELLRLARAHFGHPRKAVLGIPAWKAKLLARLPLPLPFNEDQVTMAASLASTLRSWLDQAPLAFTSLG